MKKIVYLTLILIIISSAAPAQRITSVRVGTQRFNSVRITRPERFQLRRDAIRLKLVQYNARRDDVVTPLEKRRIHKAKSKIRRNVVRFRHNGRH
jgi:hypothetical protein